MLKGISWQRLIDQWILLSPSNKVIKTMVHKWTPALVHIKDILGMNHKFPYFGSHHPLRYTNSRRLYWTTIGTTLGLGTQPTLLLCFYRNNHGHCQHATPCTNTSSSCRHTMCSLAHNTAISPQCCHVRLSPHTNPFLF